MVKSILSSNVVSPTASCCLIRIYANDAANNFAYSNYYSGRAYDEQGQFGTGMQEDFYYGYRDAFSYLGIYNINLEFIYPAPNVVQWGKNIWN